VRAFYGGILSKKKKFHANRQARAHVRTFKAMLGTRKEIRLAFRDVSWAKRAFGRKRRAMSKLRHGHRGAFGDGVHLLTGGERVERDSLFALVACLVSVSVCVSAACEQCVIVQRKWHTAKKKERKEKRKKKASPLAPQRARVSTGCVHPQRERHVLPQCAPYYAIFSRMARQRHSPATQREKIARRNRFEHTVPRARGAHAGVHHRPVVRRRENERAVEHVRERERSVQVLQGGPQEELPGEGDEGPRGGARVTGGELQCMQ